MKKLLLALSAFALVGCDLPTPQIPPAPASYAGRTAIDEQARNSTELLYKAYRAYLNSQVDSGKLTGAAAAQARETNATAYRSVLIMRQAYAGANAADWLAAARSAEIAIAQAFAAAGGK